MLVSLFAAAALFTVQDAPVATAPVPTPAPVPALPAPTDIPVLAPAVVSSDCGGLLNAPAFCVTASMAQTGALADAYMADLAAKGWLAAGGDNNLVVMVRRRDGGGCDGMQMLAFYDTTKPQAADTPAFLGFAYIPGDVCAASPS